MRHHVYKRLTMLTPPVLIILMVSYCRSGTTASNPMDEGEPDQNERVVVQCDHHEVPEVVKVSDIAADHVCPGARATNGVVCTIDQNTAYSFDIAARTKKDSYATIAACKAALNQPPENSDPAVSGTAAVRCEADGNKWKLVRTSDNAPISFQTYTKDVCDQLVAGAGEKVACTYFSGGERLPRGGRPSQGWRPTNIATGQGLGRYTISQLSSCLAVTEAAKSDVVCTNTGVGWKVTHIRNNNWCGSSSEQHFCLRSSRAVRDGDFACSYPASGMGHGNAWVRTRIFDCNYSGARGSLEQCIGS